MQILLGYETGSGETVKIPLAHMAVVGQTQLSGKTTTLEALIERGELRAVAFITKPGEKSFGDARRILPYFRERADWEYVKQLLEARRGESLSKWDGYLMRVCSRAKTLADVRANVEKELPKKRTARPSHYETLAGYLDLLVPELDRVPYSDKLDVKRGVNVMDLSELSDEMQSMVLCSTIERIHKHERNTVLVLPEAWKFIPEGGRSPVFDALHAFIREGATNGNFLWIDAQDIAVVSKKILKSVSVWILGRQNEANEVARTINHLIEPIAIRPDMIKTLGIGQFLVYAGGAARKVYVMPKWLGELDAQAIARGEESIETARRIFEQKRADLKRAAAATSSAPRVPFRNPNTASLHETVSELEGGPARAALKKDIPAPPQMLQIQIQETPDDESVNSDVLSATKLGEIPRTPSLDPPTTEGKEANGGQDHGEPNVAGKASFGGENDEDVMWKEKYEELEAEHKTLIEAHDALVRRVLDLERPSNLRSSAAEASRKSDRGEQRQNGAESQHSAPSFTIAAAARAIQLDDLYKEIKQRAERDPQILRVLASRPAIEVKATAKVLEVDESEPTGAIALLIHEGFFDNGGKNGNAVCKELIDRRKLGFARRTLYDNLETVARLGFLVHEGKLYRSTGRKVTVHP